MLIVVTGAAGFIGRNLLKRLNSLGYKDILAVDDLTDGRKSINLAGFEILDYIDKDDFIAGINAGDYDNQIDYIFHLGAISETTYPDGKYLMKNNYEYSVLLLEFAQKNEVPFVYASSAATYGAGSTFVEERQYEGALNCYGYSKQLFDDTVRRYLANGVNAPIVGLKYFNVYGYGEFHKGKMASVVYHHYNQYKQNGFVKLFKGCDSYADGEQSRDFIFVEDAIDVKMHFMQNHLHMPNEISGIFNCGTGVARSFNDLSMNTINSYRKLIGQSELTLAQMVDGGVIRYIDFPQELVGRYQSYTCASLNNLELNGKYVDGFTSLEDGIMSYIEELYKSRV